MEKIKKEDLRLELKEIIRDTFVAQVEEVQELLVLKFSNGQRFQIEIKEMALSHHLVDFS